VAVAQADDGYLVRQAQDGYLDAYGELAGRHGTVAYRVALRLVGNHHDAEDIAQEALLAAWEHLDRYRAESSFSTWLYQIVTRRALNQITRTRATSSLDLLGDIAGQAGQPAVTAERNQTAGAVAAAIAALPPPQRLAIVLHHLEGLPNGDIADITASTVPAVRSHLFRGRRTLTKTLAAWR
jgi:RNA polymerase sigma-70 factor, ECF subfamily